MAAEASATAWSALAAGWQTRCWADEVVVFVDDGAAAHLLSAEAGAVLQELAGAGRPLTLAELTTADEPQAAEILHALQRIGLVAPHTS